MSISLPFSIHSPFHPGGFLQFLGADSGVSATLGSGGSDPWQQWFLQPTDDGVSVSIGNTEYGTYIATAPSDGSNTSVVSKTNHCPWYLAPPPAESSLPMFAICDDEDCTGVLAPLSQVDTSQPDSTEVTLIPATGAQYEFWEIMQATSPLAIPTLGEATSELELSRRGLFSHPTETSSASPAGATITPGDVGALNECPPCGKARCGFNPTGNGTMMIYSVLVGQPVSNCNAGSRQDTKTTLGGTYTVTKSFAVEKAKNAGFGGTVNGGRRGLASVELGPSIQIESKISSGNQSSIQLSQSVEVTISPGQIGALVANVACTKTPGQITIDERVLGFVSIDPGLVVEYAVVYASCGSPFSDVTLPKPQCSNDGLAVVPGGVWTWILLVIGCFITLT